MPGETFDLYCAPSAEPFREGAVLTLDGIDGFFDQYFQDMATGTVIRFVVLVGGLSGVPRSIGELYSMPFVTARVDRSDEVSGDVEVLSRTTLGEWCHTLELIPVSVGDLPQELPGAPIRRSVAQASRKDSAFWRSGAKYWTSISDTSAVASVKEESGILVIVLKTHGVPSLVARVNPGS
jgi:hypothetical protein